MAALNNLNQAVGAYGGWPTTVGIVPLHLNNSAPLDNLIPLGLGWSMWSVHHLNDKGEIVGTAKLSGTTKGVILKPQD